MPRHGSPTPPFVVLSTPPPPTVVEESTTPIPVHYGRSPRGLHTSPRGTAQTCFALTAVVVGAASVALPAMSESTDTSIASADTTQGTTALAAVGNEMPLADPAIATAQVLTVPALDDLRQPSPSSSDVQALRKADDRRQADQRRENQRREAATVTRAPRQTVGGASGFARPVAGRVTSSYGSRSGGTHYGLDVANSIGTPIRTAASGTVISAGPASGFGLWVRVRHEDGTITVYGHINKALVDVGQKVSAGELIAEVGNRGRSSGPHLHFEAHGAGGKKLDPGRWLDQRGVGF